MTKGRFDRKPWGSGQGIVRGLTLRSSLINAVLGDKYATPRKPRSPIKVGQAASPEKVALVSEVRRLFRRGWTVGQISNLLDLNQIPNTMSTLRNWVDDMQCVKGYPVVTGDELPFMELFKSAEEKHRMKLEKERIAYLREMIEEAGLTFVALTQNNKTDMISARAECKGESRTFMIHMNDKRKDRQEAARMDQFFREMNPPEKPVQPPTETTMAAALKEALAVPENVKPEDIAHPERWPSAPVTSTTPVEPLTEPEPTMPTTPAAKKPALFQKGKVVTKYGVRVGRLSFSDQIKLFKWVSETDLNQFDGIQAGIEAGSKHVGVAISESMFYDALKEAGKEMKRKVHKRSLPEGTILIASELVRLMRELNVEPAPALIDLIGE